VRIKIQSKIIKNKYFYGLGLITTVIHSDKLLINGVKPVHSLSVRTALFVLI